MSKYMINDRTAAIRNIQRLLFMNESGVYDERTAETVREAQRRNGIGVSGLVDRETFYALLAEHDNEKMRKAYTSELDPREFPYDVGSYGVGVGEIVRLVRSALSVYDLPFNLRGSIYSAALGEAVRALRGIYGFDDATDVDEKLYVRIKRELLTING